MAIKTLELEGIRSFKENRTINFSIPDGKNEGSGLNILLGPNNGGKSTIIESLYLLNGTSNYISENVYNNSEKFYVAITNETNKKEVLFSDRIGELNFDRYYYDEDKITSPIDFKIFVVSTKRDISDNFGNGNQNRYQYSKNNGNNYRKNFRNEFGNRLIKASQKKNRESFQKELEKVINPAPEWQVKMNDNDSFYMQFKFDDVVHKSIDSGDGFINLFNIVDSIYDAEDGDTIVIDEPEISLHPELQQNLMSFFLEHSKTKQIIIATHSVFFVDWEIFNNGGKIFRVIKENNVSNTYTLSQETIDDLGKLDDPEKLPLLGLNSAEIFFLSDNVILTEGQEDVLCYKRIFKKIKYKPNAHFFGCGVYGANKMKYVLRFLNDLGYKRVFSIFDHNKIDEMEKLEKDGKFNNYKFYAIAADDVRTKEIKKCVEEKRIEGIIESLKTMDINPLYKDEIPKLKTSITEYFDNNISAVVLEENNRKQQQNKEVLSYDNIIDIIEKCLSCKYLNLLNSIYNDIEFQKGDIEVNIGNDDKFQYWFVKYYNGLDHGELNIYFKVKYDLEKKKVRNCNLTKIENNLSYSFIKKKYKEFFFKYRYLEIKENIIREFNKKLKKH